MDENKIRKGFYCHEDSQVCGPSAPGRRASSHMGCPHQPSSDWGMWSSRCPEPSSLGKATRPSGGGPTAGDLRTQNGLCPCLAQVCLLCTSELGRGEGSVQVPCPRAGPAWTPAHKTSCSQERPKPRVPILHFRAARPPFVICVKLVSANRCHGGSGNDRVAAPGPQLWESRTSDMQPDVHVPGLGHLC